MAEITREHLISLCERGRVPQDKWVNRDSANAQKQLGEALALLHAGCEFMVIEKGIIYLTPRDIRGRYLLMERIRRTLTRR